MVSLENVRCWVVSQEYQDLLACVTNALNLSVRREMVSDIALQHDSNKFNLAEINPKDLTEISKNIDVVCRYVSGKLKTLSGATDEQEGKNLEDDEDVIVQTHQFQGNFLNLYLIELYYLEKNPAGLEAYLKSIRVPGVKRYASLIRSVYKNATSNSV